MKRGHPKPLAHSALIVSGQREHAQHCPRHLHRRTCVGTSLVRGVSRRSDEQNCLGRLRNERSRADDDLRRRSSSAWLSRGEGWLEGRERRHGLRGERVCGVLRAAASAGGPHLGSALAAALLAGRPLRRTGAGVDRTRTDAERTQQEGEERERADDRSCHCSDLENRVSRRCRQPTTRIPTSKNTLGGRGSTTGKHSL